MDAGAAPLGHDFASVFVERAGLRDGVNGFLNLGIGFEKNLEAFLGSVAGHKDFLLDLAFDPVLVLGKPRLGVADVVLG